MSIIADFNVITGKIKPFNAINNAPIYGSSDKLFHYLREANIPYSRLHDTGGRYGGYVYVDIENIFRDMSADPKDPGSYDFAFTDSLLSNIVKQGTEPFFRLGATIENDHYIKAYRIYPPKDFKKWAEICEGIIKHYNCGWADGFEFNIKYWEIWNEPDNEPVIADNPMWKGTAEQYFEMYVIAANHLKAKFPDIKIGGYASCGFYALTGAFAGQGNSSSRTEYFVEFFHKFLDYISDAEHKAPLDFFSWHSYASSDNNCLYADYVRAELDRRGFKNTESILNEWNPGIQRRGTEEDACYIMEMILKLHRKPLDMIMYYDGQINGGYQGLFDPVRLDIFPAYYALHSFGELYSLGNEAKTVADGKIPVAAAVKDGCAKLLAVNISGESIRERPEIPENWRLKAFRVLDGINGLTERTVEPDGEIEIPDKKIVMLEFEKTN